MLSASMWAVHYCVAASNDATSYWLQLSDACCLKSHLKADVFFVCTPQQQQADGDT